MKKFVYLFLIGFLFSCSSPKDTIVQNGLQLKKVSFADLRGFDADNFESFANAYALGCEAVAKKPSVLERGMVSINQNAYLNACRKFEKLQTTDKASIQAFIKDNFTPYAVSYNNSDIGQFTSYYEAELRASKTKHGKYRYPIYGRPNDLVEINLKDFDKSLPDKRILGRLEGAKLKPYYTRKQIEQNGVDAPVILWGDDKTDIFLMQIQGSAVALLDDGSSMRISYADNNGHPFVGIGSLLVKKGLIQKGHASMDKIRDWLKENTNEADIQMQENPRFIFHQLSEASGPIGALGAPLTAGRSLAVDQTYIPLGSLLWLDTTAPSGHLLQKMVFAQDIGGAILGPIRGDYFWGHGEEALLEAGKMNSTGKFYLLMPHD